LAGTARFSVVFIKTIIYTAIFDGKLGFRGKSANFIEGICGVFYPLFIGQSVADFFA
jgi:hypothetical protein